MKSSFLKLYQGHLIEMFRFFSSFLEMKKIPYSAAYGTCLGAIRHSGMIPWDDDIDIVMSRPALEQLNKYKNELFENGFTLLSPSDNDANVTFYRLYADNTTIWGRPGFWMRKLWIDIFPIDKTNFSMRSYVHHVERYSKYVQLWKRSIERTPFPEFLFLLRYGHFRGVIERIANCLFYCKKASIYKKKLESEESLFDSPDGRHYVIPTNYDIMRIVEYYPLDIFDDTMLVDFEEFKVRVPKRYDEYLTSLYGNYLQFPPVEERTNKHNLYYINLEENLKKDEIRRRIKTREDIEKEYVYYGKKAPKKVK